MTDQQPRTVLDSLNRSLHQALTDDKTVFLLGEDLLDPYGGAFKVARGLSTTFPDRVITTPISEAGITGIAGGMALRGLRPVVEVMFGDFSTLIADQVINHLVKFQGMYNDEVSVPIVIRTPMGGRRGYGPTHSQTLEKFFLGIPGLTVLAPFHLRGEQTLGAPGALLQHAILGIDSPVFFVENKLQYLLKLLSPEDLDEYEVSEILTGCTGSPFYKLTMKSAPPAQVTLAAYGYMAHLAMEALHNLAYEDEVFCELLVPTQLAPFGLDPLFDSIRRTGRLLAVEEGTFRMGWGAEVLARTTEALGTGLKTAGRLAAKETVIPASPVLEADCLPDGQDIIARVREMVEE
jgi:pyruvate/2-oxoglutarate/acetoin dehydrogenase E1 component